MFIQGAVWYKNFELAKAAQTVAKVAQETA